MTLTDTLIPKPPPLHEDYDGTVRVGSTRVTLDTIVAAYWQGMTAEEIACAYDSLDLADVHAVLSFYLQNRTKVDQYVRERTEQAEKIQKQIESNSPWNDLRKQLVARRMQRKG